MRYAVDEQGGVHRFAPDHSGRLFHWNGGSLDLVKPLELSTKTLNEVKKLGFKVKKT